MPPQVRQTERAVRAQANARGVPADIMLPRVLLVVSTVLLVLLGLVMVFSASTVEAIADDESIFSYVGKQAVFVLVGAIAAVLLARFIPYHYWRTGPLFSILWFLAAVLLVVVAFAGTEALGAQRWIYIGPFSLQPTEFAKIVLIVAAVRIMCDFREELVDWKHALARFFVLVVIPLAFLFKTQSDMGSAVIIVIGVFAVAWLGEVPLRVLFPVIGVLALVACIAVSTGYRADRINVWLNPWNDGEGGYGTGFQIIHSFYAFAEGGIFGVGLGNSREKFLYLPEAETDFIYSIIGEELGMIGALAVLFLFIVFLIAGLRIAAKAPDEFGKLLAGGLTVMLVGQAFLNMACATGLFPTTGKPLPFISSGGSSVISSLLIVGMLMSVSYGSNVLSPYEQRRNNLNVLRVDRSRENNGDTSSRERKKHQASRNAQLSLVDTSKPELRTSSYSRQGDSSRYHRSSIQRESLSRSYAGEKASRRTSSDSSVLQGRSRKKEESERLSSYRNRRSSQARSSDLGSTFTGKRKRYEDRGRS